MTDFLTLTSAQDTLLYVRKSVVLYVEGFTFQQAPNVGHIGSQITLLAGQFSERCHCKEPPHVVIERLTQ